jgi:hypothetical protein
MVEIQEQKESTSANELSNIWFYVSNKSRRSTKHNCSE